MCLKPGGDSSRKKVWKSFPSIGLVPMLLPFKIICTEIVYHIYQIKLANSLSYSINLLIENYLRAGFLSGLLI